jgi:protein-L-isoaspartate(D-aspartate) O-methyltransferase
MTFDFAAARQNMIDSQVRTADVTDHALLEALRQVEREQLCPPARRALAYADAEIPLGDGRYLMRPRETAKLLQALRPKAGERALAIAAPYAAAVLKAMGCQVDVLEKGDLTAPKGKDYALILSEGAVSVAPDRWLNALGEGGRLAVVERTGPVGKARLYAKSGHGVGSRTLFDASTSVLPGFEAKPQFAF